MTPLVLWSFNRVLEQTYSPIYIYIFFIGTIEYYRFYFVQIILEKVFVRICCREYILKYIFSSIYFLSRMERAQYILYCDYSTALCGRIWCSAHRYGLGIQYHRRGNWGKKKKTPIDNNKVSDTTVAVVSVMIWLLYLFLYTCFFFLDASASPRWRWRRPRRWRYGGRPRSRPEHAILLSVYAAPAFSDPITTGTRVDACEPTHTYYT